MQIKRVDGLGRVLCCGNEKMACRQEANMMCKLKG